MKIKFKAIAGLAIVSSTLLLQSCSSDPDSSGIEYMPDMYRSPAVEPYVDYGEIKGRENKELKSKLSALTPPQYTIPYFGTQKEEVLMMLPYHRLPTIAFKSTHGLTGYDFTTEDSYLAAAADLVNPLVLTADNSEAIFASGKEIFTSKCMHCHGEKGDGNGQMMINGTFVGVPSYSDLSALSNGQLFYSIYYGKGAMGSHASLITKKQIWTLVHYIRKFQNPDYGKDLTTTVKAIASAEEVKAVDLTKIDLESSKGQSLRIGDILFESGSSKINTAKSPGLKQLLSFLESNKVNVILSGFTDTDGDDLVNLKLSQERAEAVKSYLGSKGVDLKRVDAVGKGELNPVMIGGKEFKELSRRTELTIK